MFTINTILLYYDWNIYLFNNGVAHGQCKEIISLNQQPTPTAKSWCSRTEFSSCTVMKVENVHHYQLLTIQLLVVWSLNSSKPNFQGCTKPKDKLPHGPKVKSMNSKNLFGNMEPILPSLPPFSPKIEIK